MYGDAVAAAARDDFLAAAKLAEAEVSRETPEETRGVVPATPEGVSRRTETENENEKPSERASLPPLRLFEREGCGGSKRVREALCMLDLACEMRPCPLGATRHRKLLLSETRSAPRDSSDQDQTLPSLPFLMDASTGVSLSGADAIVEYLYATYLDGEAPSPLVAPGFFAAARARGDGGARQLGSSRSRRGRDRLCKARYRRCVLRATFGARRETAAALGVRGEPVLRDRARDAERSGDSVRQSTVRARIDAAHDAATARGDVSGAVLGRPKHGCRYVRERGDHRVPARELPGDSAAFDARRVMMTPMSVARAFRCLYHMSCVFLLLKKRGLFFFVSPSLFVSLI